MPKTNDRISRETRQSEAAVRTSTHATRSASEQIAVLDKRLGVGVGAKKERARLTLGGKPHIKKKVSRQQRMKNVKSNGELFEEEK